jgi:hypothetical protein
MHFELYSTSTGGQTVLHAQEREQVGPAKLGAMAAGYEIESLPDWCSKKRPYNTWAWGPLVSRPWILPRSLLCSFPLVSSFDAPIP